MSWEAELGLRLKTAESSWRQLATAGGHSTELTLPRLPQTRSQNNILSLSKLIRHNKRHLNKMEISWNANVDISPAFVTAVYLGRLLSSVSRQALCGKLCKSIHLNMGGRASLASGEYNPLMMIFSLCNFSSVNSSSCHNAAMAIDINYI